MELVPESYVHENWDDLLQGLTKFVILITNNTLKYFKDQTPYVYISRGYFLTDDLAFAFDEF